VVTIRRFLIKLLQILMAEPEQPKKETVRIQLPHPPPVNAPPPANAPEPNVKPRETVRIQLPHRDTGSAPGPSPSLSGGSSAAQDISTNFFTPPKPPVTPRLVSASLRPAAGAPSPGPKRETVRIPLVPEALRSAQKKTQPLMAMPKAAPQNLPITVAAPAENRSMLLYWVLFGVSALILIIQIWTYFS
jgi:hypothetical protein